MNLRNIFSATGIFFSKLLPLLFFIKIIATDLGPTKFAWVSQYMGFVASIFTLAMLGIGNFITKRFSAVVNIVIENKKIIERSYGLLIFSSAIIGFLIVVFNVYIYDLIFFEKISGWIFLYLWVLYILASFSVIFASFLAAEKRLFMVLGTNFFSGILYVLIVYSMFYEYGGSSLYWTIPLLYALPGLVQILFLLKRKVHAFMILPVFDMGFNKEALKYGLAVIIGVFSIPVLSLLVRHDFIWLYGAQEAGYWQAAVKISDVGNQLVGVILAYLILPFFSRQNFHPSRKNIFILCGGYLFFAIITFFFLISIKDFIVAALFDDSYVGAASYLQIYWIGDIFRFFSLVLVYYCIAIGRWKVAVFYEILQGCVFYSIFSFVFTWGKNYVSWAYLLTYLFTAIFLSLWGYFVFSKTKIL